MLCLGRRDGEWVEVVHRSGEIIRILVYNVRPDGRLDMAFDDDAGNFDIRRPERKRGPAAGRRAEADG